MQLKYHKDAPLILLFIILCASFSSALYFHISETERKCFIEEIPDETVVIGKIVPVMVKIFLNKKLSTSTDWFIFHHSQLCLLQPAIYFYGTSNVSYPGKRTLAMFKAILCENLKNYEIFLHFWWRSEQTDRARKLFVMIS